MTFLTYARKLRFEDKPDYTFLKNLLKDLFIKSGFELDWKYDWNIHPDKEKKIEEAAAKTDAKGITANRNTTGEKKKRRRKQYLRRKSRRTRSQTEKKR